MMRLLRSAFPLLGAIGPAAWRVAVLASDTMQYESGINADGVAHGWVGEGEGEDEDENRTGDCRRVRKRTRA